MNAFSLKNMIFICFVFGKCESLICLEFVGISVSIACSSFWVGRKRVSFKVTNKLLSLPSSFPMPFLFTRISLDGHGKTFPVSLALLKLVSLKPLASIGLMRLALARRSGLLRQNRIESLALASGTG